MILGFIPLFLASICIAGPYLDEQLLLKEILQDPQWALQRILTDDFEDDAKLEFALFYIKNIRDNENDLTFLISNNSLANEKQLKEIAEIATNRVNEFIINKALSLNEEIERTPMYQPIKNCALRLQVQRLNNIAQITKPESRIIEELYSKAIAVPFKKSGWAMVLTACVLGLIAKLNS